MIKKAPITHPVFYVPHVSGLYGLVLESSAHQKMFAKLFALNIKDAFEEYTWFVNDELKSKIFKNEKDFMKRHFATYKDPKGAFWILSTTSLALRKNLDAIKILQKNFPEKIKIANVPQDMNVYIFEDDDGSESVHEEHKIWR